MDDRESLTVLKFIVGIWILLWKYLTPKKSSERSDSSGCVKETTDEADDGSQAKQRSQGFVTNWLSGILLGSAMVARGEISLLIIEIGYNKTSYMSQAGFITGVWAILLNTIIGPVTVGLLVKYYGKRIGEGEWGLQKPAMPVPQQVSGVIEQGNGHGDV